MNNLVEPKYIFKLPLIAIEKQFGKGNFDDCVEEFCAVIYRIFGSADFQLSISFDTQHDNRFFHTLCISVLDIDSTTAELVNNELIKHKLVP